MSPNHSSFKIREYAQETFCEEVLGKIQDQVVFRGAFFCFSIILYPI